VRGARAACGALAHVAWWLGSTLLLKTARRPYNGLVPSESSPVDPGVVRKIAALARLTVPDAELALWTEQLGRIVSYIDQLKELPESGFGAGAAAPTPLRSDAAAEGSGMRALEQNAPRLLHAYGVVPRVVGVTADTPPAPSVSRSSSAESLSPAPEHRRR
jgi:aspartyl-tRNA(Asn)/glutamyl-tRNA(Gln) amidotransferase subunit C